MSQAARVIDFNTIRDQLKADGRGDRDVFATLMALTIGLVAPEDGAKLQRLVDATLADLPRDRVRFDNARDKAASILAEFGRA